MRNEKVSIDTDAPNFILFFLLALRLVSGLPMCVCVCLFFCTVCRKLSVIQWQFTAGSSHAPFLLPQLETPSCESCKSQVPCFTSVHRSVPGSFCIALFRFAVFRSVQFRWFIYLVFLSSSIIKLRLCAVRCFFYCKTIRGASEDENVLQGAEHDDDDMDTLRLRLWLWLFPRCRRTAWVRVTLRNRERVSGKGGN